MDFTYHSYEEMIKKLVNHGYCITNYYDWHAKEKCAILRHDIDYDVNKALELAILEQKIGVSSTYFVLLTSDFYNVFSEKNRRKLKKIIECGHEIGLHFDEVQYPGLSLEVLCKKIILESSILEQVIDNRVTAVSMHRPSKKMLEADLIIPGMINSYGSIYFHDFKYVSDSRRRWREPVEEIIESDKYLRLHILTHAFWYEDNERTIKDSVQQFINSANGERYFAMKENITDLQAILFSDEVPHE